MTAKEYLIQVGYLDNEVKSQLHELDYWRDLSCSLGGGGLEPHYNPNRPTEAPFVKCLAKIDEIERRLTTKIDRLIEVREKCNEAIDAMENYEERQILRLRFLEGLSWERIGEIMSMSSRNACRVSEAALKKFPVPN